MKKRTVFNILSELGWEIEKDGGNTYTLHQFSNAGQDFAITINGKNAYELINSIYSCYKNFDVSYETYLWLDNTGHGKNGAPYDMEDILEDMKSCENMIYESYKKLALEQKSSHHEDA